MPHVTEKKQFEVSYTYMEGLDHHHQDYMKDTNLYPSATQKVVIEAADEEDARAKFAVTNPGDTIQSVKAL